MTFKDAVCPATLLTSVYLWSNVEAKYDIDVLSQQRERLCSQIGHCNNVLYYMYLTAY